MSRQASKTFSDSLLKKWENSDGVNFALALARLTGWAINVNWYTSDQFAKETDMIPLRVHVETDQNIIFDFTGKKSINAFNQYTLAPIAQRRVREGKGGIVNRHYSEEKIWSLPIRIRPSELEVVSALEAISENSAFLDQIPKRLNPQVPAHIACEFTFGRCAPYAEALSEVKGLPSVAIIAEKYSEMFGLSKLGYCHSVVMHPDGEAEDAWGKQPLQSILNRYGVVKFRFDQGLQKKIIQDAKNESMEQYEHIYNRAKSYVMLSY
jgi:hypothetical protein